ncbi:sphingomyelin phosphodiesterase 1 [Drosophila grimshawi]|uniref:Sphingomyelin phosphodiesterase n=1 Tax=Drosophila grimshawi TaxID=7222 RepID=B4JVA8_DROGR|nr:sphingomyelin phosphodiesterase 1 [Drosophila grimshawi]EDV91428.1 GH14054 [Drosophila grimshawi]
MKCLLVLLCGAIAVSAVQLPPTVPVDFNLEDKVLSDIADDVANRLEQEYYTFLKTGVETPAFKQLTTQLANAHTKKDIFTKDLTELETRDSFVVCTLCRSIMRVFMRTIRDEDGELHGENSGAIMKKIAMDVCRRLNLQTEEVCEGLIDAELPTVDYIMRNSEMDSQSFCSLFLTFNFCNTGSNPDYNWSLKIDDKVEAPTSSKGDTPRQSESDIKICQFSDIHHDPLYEPGSLATCDEPMCCQRQKSSTEGTPNAAGYWGDYRDCDLPWHTLESALNHAVKTEKCTYIYQTGDVVDHMVWATSIEKNTGVLSKVSGQIDKVFNVPVYPCIGNHEPHPLNLFSPEGVPNEVSTKWLYEHLYEDWSKWLPKETKETILKGGYYTVSPQKGFRIIALNGNDCYTDNYWLYYSGTDKIPQLEWFHDTLLAAEKNGEHVHVLNHIPSGHGTCWAVWAREYNRCITRFHKTISGIFNGHSHKDELVVHYSDEGHAASVAWNGGALTTFSFKNPNYRVYDVNSETFDVTNHRTYIFHLNEANNKPTEEPNWFLEYEFTKEFTEDLSPAGIDKLLDKFAENPDLMRKYWRYKVTTADPQVTGGCDRNCLAGSLCAAAVSVNNKRERCEELRQKLFVALDNEEDDDDSAAALSILSFTSLLAVVFTMRIGF